MFWSGLTAGPLTVTETPDTAGWPPSVKPGATAPETGNLSRAHHLRRLPRAISRTFQQPMCGRRLAAEVTRMELRQLRYFVTLAEELHFGRAAAREHIVQSALSQQVQRLERELGVRLLERSTHHVALTAAGAAFLAEARQILTHVDRATEIARSATDASPALRVGIIDASYDSMPQILHEVQARYSDLVIHDPLGVLVPPDHRFAGLSAIPVATLAEEPLLLAEEVRAPEFNQFTVEMCRSAGFTPTVHQGTVESIRAAADLVAQGRCLYCVPSSCISALPGTIWRPLTEPVSYYPWSVLWRATEVSDRVQAIVSCARTMSRRLGWLATASQAAD